MSGACDPSGVFWQAFLGGILGFGLSAVGLVLVFWSSMWISDFRWWRQERKCRIDKGET